MRGRNIARSDRARDARHSRPRDVDDLPGSDDVAQSGAARRRPDRGGHATSPAPRRARAREVAHRAAASWSAFPTPDERSRSYPHEFSGGMRQRAMIAMAIAMQSGAADRRRADDRARRHDPGAGHASARRRCARRTGAAMILITHDLGVVAETARPRRGDVWRPHRRERGRDELFSAPRHPYTRGLLRSLPRVDRAAAELYPIPGMPPRSARTPAGCVFHPALRVARRRDAALPREVGARRLRAAGARDRAA